MDDESRQLFAKRYAVCLGVSPRDARRDIDVTNEPSAWDLGSESEGDHVRATAVAEMAPIQCRNPATGDEADRHVRRGPPSPFGPQHGARNRGDLPARERHANAVVVDDYDVAHTEANSDVTPPLDAG